MGIAELTKKRGAWWPVLTKFLLGGLLALTLIPAWRRHILKNTCINEFAKEMRKQRRNVKRTLKRGATGNASITASGFLGAASASLSSISATDFRKHKAADSMSGTYSQVPTAEPFN